jgi:hypothetical protein
MMIGFRNLALAITGIAGFVASSSQAAVLYCKDGGITLTSTACISYKGDGIYSQQGGGDTETAVEAAIKAATGQTVDIFKYGKSDENAALFSITGDGIGASSWDVLNNSVLISYISVKAADSFSLFAYDPAVNSQSFSTAGITNKNGEQQGMSHITFWYTRQAVNAVPEPATWATMLVGFGMVGLSVRRRRAARTAAC